MSPADHTSRPTPKQKLMLGAHLSVARGIGPLITEAHRLKLDVVQVFVKSARTWSARPLNDTDIANWSQFNASGLAAPIAHASYLINLGSADTQLWRKSCDAYLDELQRGSALGVSMSVLHPGSAKDSSRTAACKRVARALNEILDRDPDLTCRPVLETTAGQGATLGASFAELAEILTNVDQAERIGICADTCHLFAAGYDLRSGDAYTAMIDEIRATVGLDRICCWHVNDSVGALGSRKDRHAHIGHGELGTAGFQRFMRDPQFRSIPKIIETPKGSDERGRDWDARNLQRLRTIAARG